MDSEFDNNFDLNVLLQNNYLNIIPRKYSGDNITNINKDLLSDDDILFLFDNNKSLYNDVISSKENCYNNDNVQMLQF